MSDNIPNLRDKSASSMGGKESRFLIDRARFVVGSEIRKQSSDPDYVSEETDKIINKLSNINLLNLLDRIKN